MENNLPLVTVGIPFYNSERFLGDAVKSVLNQSYTNLELLLINDGSSDNSLQIAKSYEVKDKRVKVYSDGQNCGLPTRLNQLSGFANGKFYARMDSDDIMHPKRLETQISHLLINPEIDLLATGLVAIDENDKIIGIRKGVAHSKFELGQILSGGWAVHPTITGKTEWFKKNKYDEELTRTEDFDLWIRTVESSHFSKLEFLGLYYREESALSYKKYLISTKQSLKLYWKNRKIIGFLKVISSAMSKVIKLIIYTIFNYTGLMNFIVKKRSGKMDAKDILYHDKIIREAILDK